MQDEPTPTELIKAVADFLRNEITPMIKGHNAFKLRVGINALDLVTRQLALEPESDSAEAARLSKLLGRKGSLGELNRALADRIAPVIAPQGAPPKNPDLLPPPVELGSDSPHARAWKPTTMSDGSHTHLPPISIPQDAPSRDRRPVYIGAGIVILAAVFYWNRRRRARLEGEDKDDEEYT